MNEVARMFSSPVALRLGETLLHVLWQAAAVGASAAAALAMLQRRSARLRYLVATGAMAVLIVSAAVTFLVVEVPARARPLPNVLVAQGRKGGAVPARPPVDGGQALPTKVIRIARVIVPGFSSMCESSTRKTISVL